MLKYLRSNQQVFTAFIFLYCFISVFVIFFFHPESVYSAIPFKTPFLGDFTGRPFTYDHKDIGFSLVSFFTFLIAGFYLVRININHLIIPNRSQFPALFFISAAALALRYEMYSSVLFATFFLLLSIDRLFGAIQKQGLSYRFLDAGILIALGSLFYFNLIFFFPFLWIAQFTLRTPNFREFLYTLIGLSIPFLYIFSGYYVLDLSIAQSFNDIKEWLFLKKYLDMSWTFLSGILFYACSMFIANIYALKKFATTKIHVRKLFQLWFYLFLNALMIYLVIPSAGIEILIIMAIPSSVLLSIYFTDCRDSIANRVFLFLLITVPVVLNLL